MCVCTYNVFYFKINNIQKKRKRKTSFYFNLWIINFLLLKNYYEKKQQTTAKTNTVGIWKLKVDNHVCLSSSSYLYNHKVKVSLFFLVWCCQRFITFFTYNNEKEMIFQSKKHVLLIDLFIFFSFCLIVKTENLPLCFFFWSKM